jgi:hypothetical protein
VAQVHVRAPVSKPPCLSSHRASFVNSYGGGAQALGASPTRGSSLRLPATAGRPFNGDHDVTAASRPVKAFVPVRIRLVTPISIWTTPAAVRRFAGSVLRMGWSLSGSNPHVGCKPTPWIGMGGIPHTFTAGNPRANAAMTWLANQPQGWFPSPSCDSWPQTSIECQLKKGKPR